MKHGSFTQSVKEEITGLEYTNEEYLPLLSGFIKTNGSISISSRNLVLSLQTENAKVAKLVYQALVSVFKVSPQFSYSRKMKLDKGVVYHLSINDRVEEILRTLQIADGMESLTPREIVDKDGNGNQRFQFHIADHPVILVTDTLQCLRCFIGSKGCK